MAVFLIFLLGVFGRQLFTRASENIPPLETMAYTVFGLLYVPWLFGFHQQDHLSDPALRRTAD